MFQNYFKTALRNFTRQTGYTLISVFGLAIGIASSLLIVLYVLDAFSFDQFHAQGDRIYRLLHTKTEQGEQATFPSASPLAASEMEAEFPAIEEAVRMGFTAPVRLGYEGQNIVPEGSETWFATPNILSVFSFPSIAGDLDKSLAEPYSIVLTEALAKRLFGEVDPLGKVLEFHVYGRDEKPLQVTGLLKDVPANSHLQFECLVSFATLEAINPQQFQKDLTWDLQNTFAYLLLKEERAIEELQAQFPSFLERHTGTDFAADSEFELQSLADIHLHSAHIEGDRAKRGDWQLLMVLIAVAMGILLVAIINYVNLATARSAKRAQEIGVRKTLGADRQQLVIQFLIESTVLALVALGAGLVMMEMALPHFTAFTDKSIFLDYSGTWYLLLAFGLALGLLAGLYPAFYLSVFRPVDVLKGNTLLGSSGRLRKGLVVVQFTVACLLFIATGAVWEQMEFIQQKDLGLEKEQVLQTVIPSNRSSGNEAFQQELLQHPNILHTGRATVRPLYDMQAETPSTPVLVEKEDELVQPSIALRKMEIGYGFPETFGMELLAGRTFTPTISSDASEAFLLNETAIQNIGWKNQEDALGKTLVYEGRKGNVIGVVKDFHFESLHSTILPFVMVFNKYSPMVFIKIKPDDTPNTLAYIEKTWEKHATTPDPFHYTFMSDYYENTYSQEQQLQTILCLFALLGIFIACLGVLGLTAFTVEQRLKEIGVRKILGASATSIVQLLSADFLKLILPAFALSVVLAWHFIKQWLMNFAYHIELSGWVFIGAGALVIMAVVGTVALQSLKAALGNPVESLRSE